MRVGVLLTPHFLEAEAALVLEACRVLGLEAFTIAKSRSAHEGVAGSIWTPKYAFSARPEMQALVVVGGTQMSKLGQDAVHREWLSATMPGLQAVFLGANASLFWLESSQLNGAVAAHPLAVGPLAEKHITVVTEAVHWQQGVCSTQGYGWLVQALLDWQLAPPEVRAALGRY